MMLRDYSGSSGPVDVSSLRVASPCNEAWASMTGDAQMRHCASCDRTVYNLSEMSTRDIESLLAKKEGRVCIRFYRRADGTVLVDDCPIGLREFRRRTARLALFILSVLSSLVLGFLRSAMMPVQRSLQAPQTGMPHGEPPTGHSAVTTAAVIQDDNIPVQADDPEAAFCWFPRRELAIQRKRLLAQRNTIVEETGGGWTMGAAYSPYTYSPMSQLTPSISTKTLAGAMGDGATDVQRQIQEATNGYEAAEKSGNQAAAAQFLLRRNALDKRLRALRSGN